MNLPARYWRLSKCIVDTFRFESVPRIEHQICVWDLTKNWLPPDTAAHLTFASKVSDHARLLDLGGCTQISRPLPEIEGHFSVALESSRWSPVQSPCRGNFSVRRDIFAERCRVLMPAP